MRHIRGGVNDPKQSKGMPLGNLTSQSFANVYLNEFDQFVKHKLKAKYYIRYVDDFVILHESKEQLQKWKIKVNDFLKEQLKIELHPSKSNILKLDGGINFLGFRVFFYHKLIRKSNFKNFEKRFNNMKILFDQEVIGREKALESVTREFLNKYFYLNTVMQSNSNNGNYCDYYVKILKNIIIGTKNFKDNKRILSIGSGLALVEIFAAKLFSNSHVICLDFAENACKESIRIAKKEGVNNIDFVIADAKHLPFKKGRQFNVVWLFGALSFRKDEIYRQEVENMVKTGGTIISM